MEEPETADINNTNTTVSPKLLSEKQHKIGTDYETTKTGAFAGEPSFKTSNEVQEHLLKVPKETSKQSSPLAFVGKRARQPGSLDD